MDPDRRIRVAIALVFRNFAEYGSIRQVHPRFRSMKVELTAGLRIVSGGILRPRYCSGKP